MLLRNITCIKYVTYSDGREDLVQADVVSGVGLKSGCRGAGGRRCKGEIGLEVGGARGARGQGGSPRGVVGRIPRSQLSVESL